MNNVKLARSKLADPPVTPRQESAQAPILHQAADDLHHWLLFRKRSGDLYIVGSLSLDRYLIVPAAKLEVTLRAVSYLDGTHDLAWIQKKLASEYGRDVALIDLFTKLRSAGLIKTANVPRRPYSEILRHSIPLFEASVSPIFKHLGFLQSLFSPLAIVAGLTLICLGLSHFSPSRIGAVSVARNLGSQTLDYAAFWLGLLLLAFIHECFHGFVALRYGLRPVRINGALYLGFIPYIFITIHGIYTVRPAKRVAIWSAGVYANLLAGALLLLALPNVAPHGLLAATIAKLIWANLVIIGLNLSPFMATDAYFILSTLVRTPNIRTNAYLEFRKWLRRERHNFHTALAVYFVVSSAMIAWFLWRTLIWIANILSGIHNHGFSTRVALDGWPLLLMIISALLQVAWSHRTRRTTL